MSAIVYTFFMFWWRITQQLGIAEFAGLENDGVEQEQMYILHTMKNFNVYDM